MNYMNMNIENLLLIDKLTDFAARLIRQSYNTIAVEDAFCMALGEAEIEFNTDLDIQLTVELINKIISKVNIHN